MKTKSNKNRLKFDIIIPTRDSAKWLGDFIERYEIYGLEPIYILDSRTKDNTEEILINRGMKYFIFEPEADYAESGLIKFGSSLGNAEWILRIDDDEFPNIEMINWLKSGNFDTMCSCWGIQRFDISMVDGLPFYSLWPARYVRETHYKIYNPQFRLFRPNNIEFISQVHTPGFVIPNMRKFAPKGCFIAHFNNVLRSTTERIKKVRRYADYDPQSSWKVIDESIPELFDHMSLNFCSNGLDEFAGFIAGLPKPHRENIIDFTQNELLSYIRESSIWHTSSIATLRGDLFDSQAVSENLTKFIPLKFLKIQAEFYLTIGRLFKSNKINDRGRILWKLYEYSDEKKY